MDQVLAIVWVRTRLLINTIRHRTSGWEKVASVLTIVSTLSVSLGIAALIGTTTWTLADIERPDGGKSLAPRYGLMACFWACGFFGLVVPLLLSTGPSGIDTTRLKVFPVTTRRLAFTSWASAFLGPDHIFYYPILLVTFVVTSIIFGGPGIGQLLIFLLVPILIVTWSSGVLSLVQVILRHRRGKEIAILIGIFLLIGLAMLIPFLSSFFVSMAGSSRDDQGTAFASLSQLVNYTPPNLAADGIIAAQSGEWGAFTGFLAGLLAWLAVGGLTSYVIFVGALQRVHSGGGSGEVSGTPRRRSNFDITHSLPFLPAEVLAVMTKELRYLMRSTVGKFNLIMCPFISVLFSFLLDNHSLDAPIVGATLDRLTLYGLLMYALLFTSNFVHNSVGWEGSGFKSYLLAPVPFERVLLGKNLGIWLYAGLLFTEVILSWTVCHGLPSPGAFTSSALLFFGSMILFTTGGNFASIGFPIARDISGMKTQPSPPAVLLSILSLLLLGSIVFLFLALPLLLGLGLGHVAPLLVFLVLAVAVHRLSMGHAADLFEQRKEQVLAKLEAGS